MIKIDESKPIDVPIGSKTAIKPGLKKTDENISHGNPHFKIAKDLKSKLGMGKALDNLQEIVDKNMKSLGNSINEINDGLSKSSKLEEQQRENNNPILLKNNAEHVLKQVKEYAEEKRFYGKRLKIEFSVKDNMLYADTCEIVSIHDIKSLDSGDDYLIIKTINYQYILFFHTQDDLDYTYLDSIRKDEGDNPGDFIFINTLIYEKKESSFDYSEMSKKEKKEMDKWLKEHKARYNELINQSKYTKNEYNELIDLEAIYDFYEEDEAIE